MRDKIDKNEAVFVAITGVQTNFVMSLDKYSRM